MSEKELARLVKEVVEHPEKYQEEAKYLLKISTWYRQGSAYTDTARFEIIYGEAETILISEWDEGYPHRRGKDYIVIPKTVPVIILWTNKYDYESESGETIKAYIFTSEGWKEVLVSATRQGDP